jgi:hypothetical protein
VKLVRMDRRRLIVFTVAGLAVLSYFHPPGEPPAEPMSQDIGTLERLGERPRVSPVAADHAFRTAAAIESAASRRAAEPPSFSQPSTPPPSARFKFLGKIAEGDETVVLLYANGQTLAVRGIGRLDDDYVVDVLQEAYVVLRAVSTSETQIVQLSAVQPEVVPGWTADTSAQD